MKTRYLKFYKVLIIIKPEIKIDKLSIYYLFKYKMTQWWLNPGEGGSPNYYEYYSNWSQTEINQYLGEPF